MGASGSSSSRSKMVGWPEILTYDPMRNLGSLRRQSQHAAQSSAHHTAAVTGSARVGGSKLTALHCCGLAAARVCIFACTRRYRGRLHGFTPVPGLLHGCCCAPLETDRLVFIVCGCARWGLAWPLRQEHQNSIHSQPGALWVANHGARDGAPYVHGPGATRVKCGSAR